MTNRLIAIILSLSALCLPTHAAIITVKTGVADGVPYPYTQRITDTDGSFDLIMDAKMFVGSANGVITTGSTSLYVSTAIAGTIGIKKSNTTTSSTDINQINSDEILNMTVANLTGSTVNFVKVDGSGSVTNYFPAGRELYLYKNNVLERTIICDGINNDYAINPAIQANEGDTISFGHNGSSGAGVRLAGFEVTVDNYQPYIPQGAATTKLLNATISTNGQYYLTANWSGLTSKPNGVVAKVTNANTGAVLYFRGAMGPSTAKVDFDLRILQPGDTVEVMAGVTGNPGENTLAWTVSLDRYDSWAGTRYQVPEVPVGTEASALSGLAIHNNLWPKHSAFRQDFRGAHALTTFSNYLNKTLGHAPKCYSEELSTSYLNMTKMQSWAQSRPDAQAMLHWNGRMARPFDPISRYPAKMSLHKPYHFLYNAGTKLSSSIGPSNNTITVDNVSVFNATRILTSDVDKRNVAIVIPLDPITGERQFDRSELVTITGISGNQLTVTRNVYQSFFNYTSAGTFPAGSYIAPAKQDLRAVDGGVNYGGLNYNFSLLCPVDEQGRNASDLTAEMLSYEFASGQDLQRFHGIMFDVLSRSASSDIDCDLNGTAEGGEDPRGVDLFHLGVQSMARKLRAALPNRIITFDGNGSEWPSLHNVFNGMESEGFDQWNDAYTRMWSMGVNYYLFTQKWNPSGRYQYNFCVTKTEDLLADDPMDPILRTFHRAALTILGVTFHYDPTATNNTSGPFIAPDETSNGTADQNQWLGAPRGEMIRQGLLGTDQLGGAGLPASGWSASTTATVSDTAEGLLVTPINPGAGTEMVIEFPNIPVSGELLVSFEGKGGLPHLPDEVARSIKVEVLNRANASLTESILEGAVNNQDFTRVTAYYRNGGGAITTPLRTVTLRLTIESATNIALRNFKIHRAADTMVREFRNGIVLCNPAHSTMTFNLGTLFPGQTFRRIQGVSDPVVNDGSAVGSTISLAGYRGIFLVKNVPSNYVPVFTTNAISGGSATAGVAYSGSIASLASDADGDTLTFSKKGAGPAWLTVSSNGAISGTPGNSDVGVNQWTIEVTDGFGGVVTATLSITVRSVFAAWADAATTFTADANADGVADGLAWLLGASSPSQNASLLIPDAMLSDGNFAFSFRCLKPAKRGAAVLKLQYSNDLGITDPWSTHTIVVPATSSTVDGVGFVITPVALTDYDQVQAIIPASVFSSTGRIFVRLLGEAGPL